MQLSFILCHILHSENLSLIYVLIAGLLEI